MYRFLILVCLKTFLYASITDPISVCIIRVSFAEDSTSSTTGDGQFLMTNEGIDCGPYIIDPPPHDYDYFFSQLKSVDMYFQNVSYGKFGIDIPNSHIYPTSTVGSYQLTETMDYYNPYDNYSLQEKRLTELFRDAILKSYDDDQIEFSNYDLVIAFHAGIGQDFSLPFLDPTPEDIPSTFIDEDMILEHLGASFIAVGNHNLKKGILLPETQNHLLFDISESMFSDAENPCEYQYGLTGTFSLMLGFAIGLPPLWNIETGESGVGIFGLMDQGSNNGRGIIPAPPTAWTRIFAGWETPIISKFGLEYSLPVRSENSILKVPIRDDEYYLLEARSNWIRPNISIDSMRYAIGSNSSTNTYPPYIEILHDSSGLEKDSNGVIISVPNYDIGLPESGLLIWHIDESVINAGLSTYSVNSNLLNRGVDLEEADGAQDIGFVSLDIFNDPSSGWFGDLWYKGNSQYVYANPSMSGLKPMFSYDTYPSTVANDNSPTFIRISDISRAKDTMKFKLSNSYIIDKYPDSTFYYILSFDMNKDGLKDFIGGKDSIYIQLNNENMVKKYFHNTFTEDVEVIIKSYEDRTSIHLFEFYDNSLRYYEYDYMALEDSIVFVSDTLIETLLYPVLSEDIFSIEWKNIAQWESHKKRVFLSPNTFSIGINNKGITSENFGDSISKWETKTFTYLAGIDIDLDTNGDLLALDSNGILYAFNYELTLMPSFPLDTRLSSPILSQNIMGDETPEIIGKSKDKKRLHIFNSKGIEVLNIATVEEDDLIALGEYQGRNCIFTQSTIYQFDMYKDPKGNTWSMVNGDIGKTRRLNFNYTFTDVNAKFLQNAYCYPNPIRDGLGTIRVETYGPSNIDIKLYDLAGYFIKSFSANSILNGIQVKELVWDTSELHSGLYFAHVSVSNDDEVQTKIVKIAVVD